jgi:hypothetical protein
MSDAIALFATALTARLTQSTTHQVLIVSGWDSSAAQVTAIARYLIGLRACAINAVLAIRAEVAETDEDRIEILENVYEIVGATAAVHSKEQKERVQYPWLAEGIWHLCFASAQTAVALHPPGRLLTVSLPHPSTNDHGLDIAAIYESATGLGLSIVETKAYPNNPDAAISKAAAFYKEVDEGVGTVAVRLRQIISQMRSELPPVQQANISLTLWKQMRSYLPNPHYDSSHAQVWENPRPSLNGLFPGPRGVLVMPHIVNDFGAYFERISQAMRDEVQTL